MPTNPLLLQERAIIRRATNALRSALDATPSQLGTNQTFKAGVISLDGKLGACGQFDVTPFSEFIFCEGPA